MVIKRFLKIGTVVFFILLILISGLIMLRKLNHDKQVFDEDLYAYVPSGISGIFQINKAKDVKPFSKYFSEIKPVLLSIDSFVTYPLLMVSDTSNNLYIVAKVTEEQERTIKSIFSDSIFSAFPPKTRIYKGATIFFYPSTDNRFFACMFYNGIFVGGYNYDLLERIIDTERDKGFFADNSLKSLVKEIKPNYSANLLFKENNSFSVFNGNFNKQGNLELSGYTESNPSDSKATNDSVLIDYAILPDSLLSYKIDFGRCDISEDFKPYFETVQYNVELDSLQQAPVFLIKYKEDRFTIFDKLNALERSYIGRKLSTKDVVLKKQHIYTTSEQLALSVFGEKTAVTMSFYSGYLVYSTDRNALIRYLGMRERDISNHKKPDFISTPQQTLKSLFVSSNSSRSQEIPFRSFLSKIYSYSTSIEIKTYYNESERMKTEIVLNN